MNKSKKIKWGKLLLCILLVFAIGNIFTIFTANDMKDYYSTLIKPKLVPPPIVFPIVWSILYTLMGISLYIVSEKVKDNNLKKDSYFVFFTQLLLNAIWTPIYFSLKLRLPAFLVILLIILLVIYMIILFNKTSKIAGYLQIPYALWLCLAGYLNLATYLLNR